MTTTASKQLRSLPAYQELAAHYDEIAGVHLRDLFASDPGRGTRLTADACGIHLDYSKNRVTDETLRLLFERLCERIADDTGTDPRDADLP